MCSFLNTFFFQISTNDNSRKKSKKTLFFTRYRSQQGNNGMIELLIKRGIDIDALTDNGKTALFNAVENGHSNVVKMLLENNADPNFC